MTPLILLALLAFVLLMVEALAVLAVRRVRQRLPAPNRPSRSYDLLAEQLRVNRERSIERTAALNRDLEILRTGRGSERRHDR